MPGELRINEVLPNPDGTDTGKEWIELKNVGDQARDISGVTVRRESGLLLAKVPDGTLLGGGALILLDDLSGSIVNGGDTLVLMLDSLELDRITYDQGDEDASWSRRTATEGSWTKPGTPGAENAGGASAGTPTPIPTAVSDTPAATRAVTAESRALGNARTAGAGTLPQSGPGVWPYALPLALATLYGCQRLRILR